MDQEFHAEAFADRLAQFHHSAAAPAFPDACAQARILALEDGARQRDREIARLSARFARVEASIARLFAAVDSVRPGLCPQAPAPDADCDSGRSLGAAPEPLPVPVLEAPARSAGLGSAIVSGFPALFADFRGRRFELLWRGSRDGFRADDFHRRCDWHSNTLSIILDARGHVFGGFTPSQWEPRKWNGQFGEGDNRAKADRSLRSFLFTLKNPHSAPPRKFPLKAGKWGRAILCDKSLGPDFGDIRVSDNCNAPSAACSTWEFGTCYVNDTGVGKGNFFTNSRWFKVKEIEVFEIVE
jgi:hypothetical protein